MRQSGVLHQVGDADAMRAFFPQPHRGFFTIRARVSCLCLFE
jgi:hypothetical protein